MLKVYNTLTRKVETFKPLKGKEVKFYSCGPTVWNYAHVGNLRTYIFNDLIKRSMTFLRYKVNHVMNITDIDDRIISEIQKQNLSLTEFTRKYEKIFFEDLSELNINSPDHVLRATESIPEMVDLIKKLMKKGYAYKTSDGIYFSIDKFKNYGKLAQLDKTKSAKSRVNTDKYEKENAQDFALWKFWIPADGKVFWNTEIGKGRPGWHIECSAMSTKIFGPSLDIHTGAVDLVFPHHTNEIAQSEGATGKKFVKYWMHGGFLTMKEGKMAKSVGNVAYLKDLKAMGFSPLEYRYMCLQKHYREPLEFSQENLEAAKNGYQRLKNICAELKDDGKTNKESLAEFSKAIEDDINLPKALTALWGLLRDQDAKGKYNTIEKMDEVLGLKLLEKEKLNISSEVKKLVAEREKARKAKDWKKSDMLRDDIRGLGWEIKDTPEGQKLMKS